MGARKDWVKLHSEAGGSQIITTPPSPLTRAKKAQKSQLLLPVVVDHAYVVEPHKGPTRPHCQVVVILGVDCEAFGLHQLPAVLRQVYQDFWTLAVLPQIILSAKGRESHHIHPALQQPVFNYLACIRRADTTTNRRVCHRWLGANQFSKH